MIKNFEDLYKKTDNPLIREGMLETLLQLKGKIVTSSTILTANSSNKKYRNDRQKYKFRDQLNIALFETWKSGILSLSKQEIANLKKRNSYDGKIYELYDCLSHNDKTINTYEELQELLKKNPIINEYCWDKYITGNASFVHVYSRELRGKQEEYMEIRHRLYLNPEPDDMYYLIGKFTGKAIAKGIPFYYKFNDHENKKTDDEIIMYADDSNIFDYLMILEEISRESPELKKRMHKPPILTGYIDNWIGYAAEPLSRDSYNNTIARAIDEALRETKERYSVETQKIILRNSISQKMKEYGYDNAKICFSEKTKENIIEEK